MRICNGGKVVILITLVVMLGLAVSPAFSFAGGPLVGWGQNEYGQATVPSGFNFTAIAAGYEHSLALRADGSLVGWGNNDYGQTDVPTGTDFTAISAGDFHGLALRGDGSLVGWGYCQTDVPTGTFIAIAAGSHHNIAIIPEPATMILLGVGLLGLVGYAKKKKLG